jgi:hypothetical protein
MDIASNVAGWRKRPDTIKTRPNIRKRAANDTIRTLTIIAKRRKAGEKITLSEKRNMVGSGKKRTATREKNTSSGAGPLRLEPRDLSTAKTY